MPNPSWRRRIAAALSVLTLIGGCSSSPPPRGDAGAPAVGERAAPPQDPSPRAEARSRYGNGPVYEVLGQRYEVLDSSYGFRERGVASWYGKKFHGRLTSSRERYDMYAMTAAHKSLPLPTYVEVRNLKNGRRVVVRVNDRGPFVDNRIIDLSYAAAQKLGMVRDGTSLVEIEAISFDPPPQAARATPPQPLRTREQPVPATPERPARVFVQVGAFGDKDNASRRHHLLHRHGIVDAFVHEDSGNALYRVRIGPIDGVDAYDELLTRLEQIGISESHLVTD